MPFASVPDLVQSLRTLRLLEPEQLAELQRVQARFTDPLTLARHLIQRNWLTAYQVNQLFAGRGSDLILGSYVVLQRLGEGGMGQVFKARHQRLGRVVALKVIRKDRLANPEAVKRFGREVQVAAQIDHPNVVHTYDADEAGGTLFFAMEYVEGTDLTRLVRQRGPLPVARACDYIRQAALGLDGCYQAGLVHRDIKPSNLLVVVPRPGDSGVRAVGGTSGHVVKLLDLGLARLTEADGTQATRLTQLGSVLGTPDFLAPEQARDSRNVDIRADLYSLGCTLYYILTGKTPFGEGTTMEKLLRHQMEQAPPLERVRPEVPPELGAVVRKLMAKRPDDRYQTPIEAAVALEPFTRRVRSQESGVRSQQPVLAAIPVATAVAATASAPAAQPTGAATAVAEPHSWSALQPVAASPRPVRRSPWMTFRTVAATVLLGVLLVGLLVVSRPWSGPGAGSSPPPGGAPKDQASPLDRLDPTRLPQPARLVNQPSEVVAVLGDQRLRHWAAVQCVAFPPRPGQVASGGADGTVRVWDTDTGEEKQAFHEPDGNIIGLAYRGPDRLLAVLQQPGKGLRVKVWNLKNDKSHLVLKGTPGMPVAAALAPGGKFLAASFWKPDKDGGKPAAQLKVWELDKGEEKMSQTGPPQVPRLALAPDGRTLAVAADKEVRLLDVDEGKEKGVLKGHEGQVQSLAFAPDGATLASAAGVTRDKSAATEVKLWKVDNDQARSTFSLPGQAGALAVGPEGRFLAVGLMRGGTSDVRLWRVADAREPNEVHTLGGYAAPVAALAFDPAGKILATAGSDNAVRLWNLDSGKERVEAQGTHGPMTCVAFAPDAHALAAAGGFPDQAVKVWDPATGKERSLPHKGGWTTALGYVAGGKALAVSGPGAVTLLDSSTGQERTTVRGRGAVAPDGSVLVVAGPTDQTLKLWDGARDKEIGTLPGHARPVTALAFSADGRLLASGGPDGEVKLWDLTTRKERHTLPGLKGAVLVLAFSPDGKLLAAASGQAVKLWDLHSGKERPALPDQVAGKLLTNLAFGPDGKTLYAWGFQGVRAWDVATEQARPLPQGQEGQTRALALAPDGQRLVTVAPDGRVQLWNPATGEKVHEVRIPGPVHGMAFAPDGRHLATANGNGTVYILRLPAAPAEPR
jgi:serine/threonine-protein kinase